VDQSLAALKEGITKRKWEHQLPSEESMCRQLNVSRVTLRKALTLLTSQGWINAPGKGNPRLISPAVLPPPQNQAGPGHVIRLLSPAPELEMVHSSRVILDEIKSNLAARGYQLEWMYQPLLWKGHPARRLQQITSAPDTAGWLLFRSNPWLQQAFSRMQLPCLALGPAYPGVPLSSVQVDNAALGRHAAAEARRLGHQHLAWVAYDIHTASALSTLEGLRSFPGSTIQPLKVSVIVDDLTTHGLRQSLTGMLAQPLPPTLLMLMTAAQILPVMGILRETGLRVPEDISLMVRDHEPFLDRCIPSPHRYTFDWRQFGRNAARILMTQITTGPGHITVKRLIPSFISGETLARCPALPSTLLPPSGSGEEYF